MALRASNDETIETEPDWVSFFVDVMKFSPKSSSKYAKYLCKEGFTGEILEQSIEEPNLKDCIGMLLGEFLKLKNYIKSSISSSQLNTSSHGRNLSKLPRPSMKMDSTQMDYDQFVFEWHKYKVHYQLCGDQASTDLFFCCSDELRQHIRTKQNCMTSTNNWTEKELLELIKDIATSKISPIVHIQEFMKMKQHADEKCEKYLRRLQIKASCCGFTCTSCNAFEKRVKEKFILGLKNSVIQTQVLKTESITPGTCLSKILTEALTLEQSITDQTAIAQNTSAVFAAEGSDSDQSVDQIQAINRSYNKQSVKRKDNTPKSCSGCGSKDHQDHERSRKCKAWKLRCNSCGNIGHLSRVCRQSRNQPSTSRHNVRSAEMSCLFIGGASSLDLPVDVKPISTVHTDFINISVFPDTGANICLLGPEHLKILKLDSSKISHCYNKVDVAGGSSITATGWFKVLFSLNDKKSEKIVYFSKKAKRFYLSRQGCMELGVISPTFPFPPSVDTDSDNSKKTVATVEATRTVPVKPASIPFEPLKENIPKLKEYIIYCFRNSAFNRSKPFPKLAKPPAHIHLKPDHKVPKPAHWPSVVAEHWEKEAKASLFKDVDYMIMRKVPFNEPSVWCARMVLVAKKDGRPRRTVDYQQLNAQCLREPFYGEPPFHAARRVPSKTWKSILDAVDGYHSVELDEESSKLTTFISPWGRFRYLRFPQGHISAGDAFNSRVQEILSGIPRLVRVVDDMCIFDDTIEGAFWHVWELLETCVKNGIVINESKFQFCKQTVEFAGLSITFEGLQPSERIMTAIRDFPIPTDITKARAFFGLVNQVQWAYANCQEMAPFRDLVKPKSFFLWNDELRLLFKKCKSKILHQVCEGVRKYDIHRITCLQTDFSKTGLGYLLLQKHCTCSLECAPICCNNGWKLVFAGSRFTKGAEERYAPTEGELLAVVWALEHSHIFTKGCPNLIISTDHKPLLGILNDKPLEDIKNPRIVRMKERTLSYRYVMKYTRGKWNRGPDALSRNPSSICFVSMLELFGNIDDCESDDEDDDNNEESGVDVILALNEISEKVGIFFEDVQTATANDPVMITLMATIQNGFPETQHLTDPSIRKFFNIRGDLWVQRHVVMFKNRIVIPTSLRAKILQVLHSAHQGEEGMKARAARSIYWPGLNEAIRQKREGCATCVKIAPSQAREPLQMLPPPDYPFQHLSMDAFEIGNHKYLAAVDKFSNWLLIFHIRGSLKSKHVMDSLRSIFVAYGTPQTLFTDGGLQFQSHDMEIFLDRWNVKHVTSSAMYPQSNGRAELAVKSARRILAENTSKLDGSLNTDDACRSLLQYRNTPIKHIGLSPAQILFHRKLRDGIPMDPSSLRLNKMWLIAAKQRENSLLQRNKSLTDTYDQHTKQLPILSIGTEVVIQDQTSKRWNRYGTIVNKEDRKYFIHVPDSGRTITRNRKFIRKASTQGQRGLTESSTSTTTDSSGDIILADASPLHVNVTPVAEASGMNEVAPAASADQESSTPAAPGGGDVHPAPGEIARTSRMLKRLLPFNKAGLKE